MRMAEESTGEDFSVYPEICIVIGIIYECQILVYSNRTITIRCNIVNSARMRMTFVTNDLALCNVFFD